MKQVSPGTGNNKLVILTIDLYKRQPLNTSPSLLPSDPTQSPHLVNQYHSRINKIRIFTFQLVRILQEPLITDEESSKVECVS